MSGRGMRSRRP